MTIDTERLRELTAELGFMPSNDRRGRHRAAPAGAKRYRIPCAGGDPRTQSPTDTSVQLRKNLLAVEVDGRGGFALAEMHEGGRSRVEDGLDGRDMGRGIGAGGPPGDNVVYR